MEEVYNSELEGPSEGMILRPHEVQRCFHIISSTNARLDVELESIASANNREDDDKDLRGWKSDARKLSNSKPRMRKLAFIGRTGAGKSTAINAILRVPALSTRADVSDWHYVIIQLKSTIHLAGVSGRN